MASCLVGSLFFGICPFGSSARKNISIDRKMDPGSIKLLLSASETTTTNFGGISKCIPISSIVSRIIAYCGVSPSSIVPVTQCQRPGQNL